MLGVSRVATRYPPELLPAAKRPEAAGALHIEALLQPLVRLLTLVIMPLPQATTLLPMGNSPSGVRAGLYALQSA